MNFKIQMSPEEVSKRIDLVLNLPFHKFLGLTLLENGPGFSKATFGPSENTINVANVVHGGIIYAVLDFAAYVALLPMIQDNQNAATHDIHVSMLRAAPIDEPLILTGTVRKIGKRLAFCDAEAFCGDQLIATGRVTKSILEYSGYPLKDSVSS